MGYVLTPKDSPATQSRYRDFERNLAVGVLRATLEDLYAPVAEDDYHSPVAHAMASSIIAVQNDTLASWITVLEFTLPVEMKLRAELARAVTPLLGWYAHYCQDNACGDRRPDSALGGEKMRGGARGG